ncbi:DUF2269 family protein [Marinobacterium mangrovicola]|uniref:Putative membrane protein n=1 Tax=Marinobacterium mangrovicola TaxID=1476959 RepID=A0A4R1GLB8_9GAMM|nr:DUF2269 domain-containing protein [Marinobacterium mangrovicola]TCK09234.1 putative membrane protein [Marinobacterium mangrovicola]
MEYLIIKWLHILSAILLFGTGLGSAFYKLFTDLSGNLNAIAVTNRLVVRADWMFTTPTVIIQPITGFWMIHLAGLSLELTWLWLTVGLYLFAGACWVPVVVLQIQMRDQAESCLNDNTLLPPSYHQQLRIWTALGIPAFLAMVVVTALMVIKPI